MKNKTLYSLIISAVLFFVSAVCLMLVIGIQAGRAEHVPDKWGKIEVERSASFAVPERLQAAEEESEEPPYLGEFTVTVYTPYCDGGKWGYQTATGVTSQHLATCAVDPEVIALGSVIYVGDLMVTAVDVGGAVQGNKVDLFYDGTQDEARAWISEFGDSANVWLSSEGEL